MRIAAIVVLAVIGIVVFVNIWDMSCAPHLRIWFGKDPK